jgi:hypothetical protein
MKIHCIVGLYVIFISALLFGFKSGSAIGNPANELANAYSTPMASSPGYQHNILLLQVDRIDADQPRLDSVWLMAYYSNSPRVDLLPIYPVNKPGALERVHNLPDQFVLTPSGEPGEAFWLEMQEINTWWNGFIMMDEMAAQKLSERLVGASVNDQGPTTEGVHLPNNPHDPSRTQVGLYQEICLEFSKNSEKAGFYGLYFSLKDHIRSNLKLSQFYGAWRLLSSYGLNLHCNFPSLQASIP